MFAYTGTMTRGIDGLIQLTRVVVVVVFTLKVVPTSAQYSVLGI